MKMKKLTQKTEVQLLPQVNGIRDVKLFNIYKYV